MEEKMGTEIGLVYRPMKKTGALCRKPEPVV